MTDEKLKRVKAVERATAWALKNKEKRAVYQKAYRATHRAEFHGYQHAFYLRNKAAINAKNRVLNKEYRERNKVRLLEYQRKYNLKRKFGVTGEMYEKLLREQKGVCAICHGVNGNGRRLAVDHDHATGGVRGLLCSPCNVHVMTVVERYQERILSAVAYLVKYNNLSIKE